MVKDFKRWTTQLTATVLYNGRGAANLLGADMTRSCTKLLNGLTTIQELSAGVFLRSQITIYSPKLIPMVLASLII